MARVVRRKKSQTSDRSACVRYAQGKSADLSLKGSEAIKFGVCRRQWNRLVITYGKLIEKCITEGNPDEDRVRRYYTAVDEMTQCLAAFGGAKTIRNDPRRR